MDAQAALDYLHSRKDVNHSQIFVFGRSLGGAVALWLAHRNPGTIRGVMIENTFCSVRRMVRFLFTFSRCPANGLTCPIQAMELFPALSLVPLWCFELLQSSRWNNEKLVTEIDVPLLLIAGTDDEIVAHAHMQDLWVAFKGRRGQLGNIGPSPAVLRNSRCLIMKGGGHNTTWMLPTYYGDIVDWLTQFS